MTSAYRTLGLLIATLVGCSSARLDPNTRAFTLYSPTEGSPLVRGIAGSPNSVNARQGTRAHVGTAGAEPRTAALSTTDTSESVQPKRQVCSSLPDPAPTRTDHWVALALRFDRGRLRLIETSPRQLRKAETTKRSMGRFAAELWIGCELIERVRFDFPLLAAEPAKPEAHEPNFEAAGQFDTIVFVPDSDRATRLELVDRAASKREIRDWPLRQQR